MIQWATFLMTHLTLRIPPWGCELFIILQKGCRANETFQSSDASRKGPALDSIKGRASKNREMESSSWSLFISHQKGIQTLDHSPNKLRWCGNSGCNLKMGVNRSTSFYTGPTGNGSEPSLHRGDTGMCAKPSPSFRTYIETVPLNEQLLHDEVMRPSHVSINLGIHGLLHSTQIQSVLSFRGRDEQIFNFRDTEVCGSGICKNVHTDSMHHWPMLCQHLCKAVSTSKRPAVVEENTCPAPRNRHEGTATPHVLGMELVRDEASEEERDTSLGSGATMEKYLKETLIRAARPCADAHGLTFVTEMLTPRSADLFRCVWNGTCHSVGFALFRGGLC